ncbi:MAG: pentapeptide repeat-containing protein [bacterium]|nr:pentapeptide repeat-containing protein [bacterium]
MLRLSPLFILIPLLGSLLGCVSVDQRLRQQHAGDRPYQAMDFGAWDLRNVHFSGADLHGVNFRGANLTGGNISEADLKNADFRNASLKKVDARRSNLAQALLFEADLRGALVGESDWSGYDFKHRDLTQTSFAGADLRKTDFTGADLNQGDLSGTDLRQTKFDYAILTGVSFKGSNLAGMDLSNQNLRGADFSGADLRGTKFHSTNLEGANFEGASLVDTDLTKTNLLKTNFRAVVIERTRFTGAQLKAPQFPRAQITRVALEGLDLRNSNFKGAWLKGLSFKSIDLSGADFSYATLEDTLLLDSNLSGADLSGTDFSKALLFNTDFTGVKFQRAIFPTLTEPKSGMVFVQAPKGCYLMGDVFEEDQGFEAPVHRVCLGDFFVAQTEVTQAQFEQMMGYNPSYHQSKKGLMPVENVSVQEVTRFVETFSTASGWKVRLPTEAEWEYACRDLGAKQRFGNGKNLANPKEIAFNADLDTNRQRLQLKDDGPIYHKGMHWKEPATVAMFPANNLGLFDFSGNVAEMVADQWDPQAYEKTQVNQPLLQKGSTDAQVVRGGHYDAGAAALRCFKRSFIMSSEMDRRVGFRLVKEITRAELEDQSRFELSKETP